MVIRNCRVEDLGALEWNGEYSHDRRIIHETFTRTLQREMAMLVADEAGELVGQAWIDFTSCAPASYVWAFRVRAPWRGRGIASHLLAAAEHTSALHGFATVEVDVELANELALAFYEHRGYARIAWDPVLQRVRLRKLLAR